MRWVKPPGPNTASPIQPQRVCRHHCAYPRGLAMDPLAPDVIEVHASVDRVGGLLQCAVVAGSVEAARRPRMQTPAPPLAAEQEPPAPAAKQATEPALEPRLEGVLERVRGGEDTLAKLCLGASDCDEPALALTELELTGLLRRTPDGRYLPSAAGHLR
jgi:hypothetical protein